MKRGAVILSLAGLLFLAAGTPPSPTGEPPPELAPFAVGNTDFAFDLHRRLVQPGANLICSPYSVTAALALAQSGARGATEQQITATLHSPAPPDFQAALGRIRAALTEAGKEQHIELVTATGLWAQRDYDFNAGFLQHARTAFAADVQMVDFSSRPDALLGQINAWASRETRGKIANALSPEDLSAATRLAFVNTLYFKGQWASRFLTRLTQTKSFRVSPEQSVSVPMMRQSQVARYAESDTAQVVELPYAGSGLSMIVLLPRAPDGLPELERQLEWHQLTNWMAGAYWHTVDLELPRFKISSRLPLIPPLSGLGLTDAFDATKADFTGMTPRRPLWISLLQQCAVVEVNEEGTVAAAATGGGFSCSAAPRPATFHANHPFLFCIRDNRTGVILFLGRVVNPARS